MFFKKNNLKIFSILFLLLLFSFLSLININIVNAQNEVDLDDISGKNFNFETSTGLKTTAEKTGHLDQKIFGSSGSLESGIGVIIQSILSLVGVIFMVLLVYGGILWMTASGNDQQVEKAKNIIIQSIIGLVIVLLAYAISVFVISQFSGKAILD